MAIPVSNRFGTRGFPGDEDFEDAVQYSVAKGLRAKYIVTRNTKDFENSEIAVVTPAEFVGLMK